MNILKFYLLCLLCILYMYAGKLSKNTDRYCNNELQELPPQDESLHRTLNRDGVHCSVCRRPTILQNSSDHWRPEYHSGVCGKKAALSSLGKTMSTGFCPDNGQYLCTAWVCAPCAFVLRDLRGKYLYTLVQYPSILPTLMVWADYLCPTMSQLFPYQETCSCCYRPSRAHRSELIRFISGLTRILFCLAHAGTFSVVGSTRMILNYNHISHKQLSSVCRNGPAFTRDEFAAFVHSNGIRHLTTAPCHPASNGLAERAVQTLKNALKKDPGGVSLEMQILRFLFRYRITPHSTTGVAPARTSHRPETSISSWPPAPWHLRVSQEEAVGSKQSNQQCRPRELSAGQTVWVRNPGVGRSWFPETISKVLSQQRFRISLEDGRVVDQHIDHVRYRVAPSEGNQPEPPDVPVLPDLGLSDDTD